MFNFNPENYSRRRSRQTDTSCLAPASVQIINGCDGAYGRSWPSYVLSAGNYLWKLQDYEMWDNLTPNFGEIVENHDWLPINRCYKVGWELEAVGGVEVLRSANGLCPNMNGDYVPGSLYPGRTTIVKGAVFPPLGKVRDALGNHHPDIWNVVDSNIAYALLEADANAKSGFDITTFIAEGNETLDFVYTQLQRAEWLMRKILYPKQRPIAKKRKRYIPPKQSTRSRPMSKVGTRPHRPVQVSDAEKLWMEWRYAATPLMYAMDDALAYFNAVHSRKQRGRHTRRFSLVKSPVVISDNDYYGAPTWYGLTPTTNITVRAGSLYDVSNMWNGLMANLGTTAWEIVSRSFVVDWFAKVGTWVTALTPQPGYHNRGLWYSVNIVTGAADVRPVNGTNFFLPDGSMRQISCPRYDGGLVTYYREPGQRHQMARFPEPSTSLNWKRVVDAMSILGIGLSSYDKRYR